MEDKDKYMSLKELSSYCSLSVTTLKHKLHGEHGIPYFNMGKKILVRKTEFDTWLENYRINQEYWNNLTQKELDEKVNYILKEFPHN